MLVKEIDFFQEIFTPYPQQKDFMRKILERKHKYFILNAHRRFGKDALCFTTAWLVASIIPGDYIYTLPKIAQAKNVIWEGSDLDGNRWLNKIPKYLLAKPHNQSERKIYFKNGSILQVTGADSFLNSNLGTNLAGVFMSEFQRTNPSVWDFIRPIINRNPNAFAVFNYTSFGNCYAHKLRITNENNPKWYTKKLTVNDTRDNEGNYIFSPEQIEEERLSGMDEDLIQQEYYCDDTVAVKGTYFSFELEKLREQGRFVKGLRVIPNVPVHTSWDMGSRDTNSIWWFQVLGHGESQEFRYFYHHDENYRDTEYYIALLEKVRKQYGFSSYGHHFVPHDATVTEYTTAKTRRVTMLEKGLKVTLVPMLRIIERVQVARSNLKKCIFDVDGCKHGIEALETYRAKYDEVLRAFTSDEVHDWSSHASTAFQYGHVGWLDSYNKPLLQKQVKYAKYRP